MDHKLKYQQLKAEADKAYQAWSVSQEPMDWEWFMQCEHAVSDYAYTWEKEIWDERGHNSISVE